MMLEEERDDRALEYQWAMGVSNWEASSGGVKSEPISDGELADIERVWNDNQT